MPPYTYHLQYALDAKPEGFDKDQVPADRGACDAAILISLLYPPDGSYSAAYFSADGRTGKKLESKEMFKAWIMWAARLQNDPDLPPARRDFAKTVFETFCNAFMPGRGGSQS